MPPSSEIHQIPYFAAENRIQPLHDAFIKDDQTFQGDDLLAGILTNLRYRDWLYALPMNRSTPILYYNKKRFAEAGLNPDKPPETWQQVREMARTLTSREGGRIWLCAVRFCLAVRVHGVERRRGIPGRQEGHVCGAGLESVAVMGGSWCTATKRLARASIRPPNSSRVGLRCSSNRRPCCKDLN